MSAPGDINGWRCDACGEITYCVHVSEGVTPMFLACRAEGVDPSQAKCKGRGVSLMYPRRPAPPHVLQAVAWEWFRPTGKAYKKLDAGMREHVDMGGLDLRPLTAAGRNRLGEHAGNV